MSSSCQEPKAAYAAQGDPRGQRGEYPAVGRLCMFTEGKAILYLGLVSNISGSRAGGS